MAFDADALSGARLDRAQYVPDGPMTASQASRMPTPSESAAHAASQVGNVRDRLRALHNGLVGCMPEASASGSATSAPDNLFDLVVSLSVETDRMCREMHEYLERIEARL